MSKRSKKSVENEVLTVDERFEKALCSANDLPGFPVSLRPLFGHKGRNAGRSDSFVTSDFWEQLKGTIGVKVLKPKVSEAGAASIKKLMEEYLSLEKEYSARNNGVGLRSYDDSKNAFNREFSDAWVSVGSWIIQEFGDGTGVLAPKSHDEGVKNFLAIKKAKKDAEEVARLAALERKLKRLKKTGKKAGKVDQDKGE